MPRLSDIQLLKPLLVGRFGVRVEFTDECWLWTASKNDKGYGWVSFRGAIWLAHRAAYVLKHGAIPKGKSVLHRCDTPACIRPSHLWVGTQKDNLQDCQTKGRNVKGSRHGMSKLTEEIVADILSGSFGAITYTEIAKAIGVSRPTVSRIFLRTHWKHVQC